ncbi:hypothetical protein AESSP_00383 [Aestuariimicrobium sp. T2.26MG-19.2B]|nr:hypothetical protein AESSP_00383 [Aestuariimicrobium sp. T2.26MG-19.2B]
MTGPQAKGGWPGIHAASPAWRALIEASEGLDLRCSGAEAWTSDNRNWRWAAALACGGCPVKSLCAAAGSAGRHHYVWGGVDRGVPGPRATTQPVPRTLPRSSTSRSGLPVPQTLGLLRAPDPGESQEQNRTTHEGDPR